MSKTGEEVAVIARVLLLEAQAAMHGSAWRRRRGGRGSTAAGPGGALGVPGVVESAGKYAASANQRIEARRLSPSLNGGGEGCLVVRPCMACRQSLMKGEKPVGAGLACTWSRLPVDEGRWREMAALAWRRARG